VLLDLNPDKPLPDIFIPESPVGPVQDFYVYDMIKNGVPIDMVASQLGMKKEVVEEIIHRQMEVEAQLNLVRDELYQGAICQANIIV